MFSQSYTYDDIGLVPYNLSTIKSRNDIDTSIEFLGSKLSMPVIVAPMETVVGEELCIELEKIGGLACLPRTKNKAIDKQLFAKVGHAHIPSFSIEDLESGKCYWSPVMKTICVDVANGFNSHLGKALKIFKEQHPDVKIITGNVGSVTGYEYLAHIGVDAVRCGIGSGGGCITSIKTAVGQGQFSLIRWIAALREACHKHGQEGLWPLIIADGGIKSPRDVVLALAAGADICMMGKVFASVKESPGPIVKFNNKLYKPYAGQASKAIKRSDKYVEGDDTLVSYSGRLSSVWNEYSDGLRSAMSYMNCKNIEELKYLPHECFCLLSSAARTERTAYAS